MQSIGQASSININGREFNLKPGKAFNYKDKALNIDIAYNSLETKQNLQQGGNSLNIDNTINLNINDKKHNIYPGEFFDYKGPGLEISVVNGHQQSRDFDKVLSQDQNISKGLKQVTKLQNIVITPVNAPKVSEVNAGRER
ncbi:hypothetical protein [Wolbachia pipientis]|uniref:hypothetical protein n=1 Tax=Wolbachia pipientis TaxID=955 RepID=UPI0025A48213|nr:hypothetical protein [Wolbachia pipientis]MDM8335428.1 hypothetical protein [Wolbachia pipientis]